MKTLIKTAVAVTVTMLAASAAAETAYPTITLNSEDYGIGTVYMADSAITAETMNPMTQAAFTEEEISALKAGESIELPDGTVLGLSVYGTDTVYAYGDEDAAAILSHADPLKLNAGTGEVTTMDGTYVTYGQTAYPGITLNSADYGIGSVYYAASYFTVDAINPVTVAAYTDDEITAVLNSEGIGMPSGAVLGLTVNGTDDIWFYTADEAAKILASADPLKLDAETGAVTTMDGTAVASAM